MQECNDAGIRTAHLSFHYIETFFQAKWRQDGILGFFNEVLYIDKVRSVHDRERDRKGPRTSKQVEFLSSCKPSDMFHRDYASVAQDKSTGGSRFLTSLLISFSAFSRLDMPSAHRY